jgi:polyhydroxyalkanoate synthesis regulator phasin
MSSDDKSKVTDKASEIAKNIWLAGVGAYGRAVEDAQGRLEKAMEPPKLFRDLVKAGSALEDEAREALEASASARSSVEERIARVRENFHNQRPARIEDLLALHKKVDQLTRKVDRLTRVLAQEGIVEPARPRKAKAAAKTGSKTSSRTKAKAKAKTGSRATGKSAGKTPARKKAATKRKS